MIHLSGSSDSADRLRVGDSALGPPGSAVRSTVPGNAEQAVFRFDLVRSLQMHRRLAWSIALGGLVLGLLYYFFTWQVYLAQSVVYIQPAPPSVLQQPGSPARWPFDSNTYESYIAQQMLNVTRTDVLAAALHSLGHGSWWKSDESEQAAIERLRRRIEVVREGSSYQFSIGVRASNPDVAANLANAVAAGYIQSSLGEQKAGDAQRLTVLSEERDRMLKELTADRVEQEELNKQLGQATIGTAAPDHFDDDIARIRAELVKARSDHDEAAARYASVDAEHGPSSATLDAEADELIATDAGLVSMKTSLNQRRAILISQMANLTPNHPQYKQDAEELAKINASLESMTNGLRAKAAARIQLRLRGDLERTAAIEARLNAQLGQLTTAAGGATSKLQRSSDLVGDIARLQSRYSTVDEQWRNLMLEDGAPGAAFLTTPAVPPLHTAKSGALRNALLIVFAGLFFSIVAAVVSHKTDPTLYIAADVEQVLGFPSLAQLPDFSEVIDGVAEEHVLRLSAALDFASKQGDLKSCIFTGTAPGAGVTTIVTQVRAMLQAMGSSAVLVDASGTPPSASSASSAEEGTTIQSDQLLAATQRGSRPSALVQQKEEEAETQPGGIVLTDTAPLIVSAETEYLARFVDCVIVIIESGVTTRTELRQVATTLQRLEVAAVGFVLNRIRLEKADPAFRNSVQAIEDHLVSKSRTKVQNRPSIEDTGPMGPAVVEETAAETQIPEKIAEAPDSNQSVPPVAAEAKPEIPEPRVQEHLFVPTEPSPVPPRTSKAPPQKRIAPMSSALPALPSWLRELDPPAAAQQAKPVPDAGGIAMTPAVSAPMPVAIGGKQSKPPVESITIHEVQPSAPAAAPLASAPKESIETTVQGSVPPAQSWERVPTVKPVPRKKAPALKEQALGGEEGGSRVASRFDGLRNFVTILGLKAAQNQQAFTESEPSFPEGTERAPERASATRTITPEPKPAPAPRVDVSPTHVTAPPEFLPPRAAAEAKGSDDSGENGSSKHPNRWAKSDEVGILPSRRGQYKKR
jgi:uncharacterized protein involved in exopolysaccharide biosynthesis